MKMSESIKTVAPALLKAQQLMGGAKKGASNPYFKSKYADLGSVLEACKDILNEQGIAIFQPQVTNEFGTFVETILLHECGEFISSQTKVVYAKEGDPQAQGSAITYARRYGLQSLLSMPTEDDDGESAMARHTKTASTVAEKQTVTPATKTKASFKNSTTVTPATPADETKVNELGW